MVEGIVNRLRSGSFDCLQVAVIRSVQFMAVGSIANWCQPYAEQYQNEMYMFLMSL